MWGFFQTCLIRKQQRSEVASIDWTFHQLVAHRDIAQAWQVQSLGLGRHLQKARSDSRERTAKEATKSLLFSMLICFHERLENTTSLQPSENDVASFNRFVIVASTYRTRSHCHNGRPQGDGDDMASLSTRISASCLTWTKEVDLDLFSTP